jgi:hypothetical protein
MKNQQHLLKEKIHHLFGMKVYINNFFFLFFFLEFIFQVDNAIFDRVLYLELWKINKNKSDTLLSLFQILVAIY